MKTQRFQAPDIQAALRAVRNAMGPDAIIMTTRETPSGIEIIAGAVTGKAHRVPTMRGRKPRSSDASAWSSVVADLARPAPRSRVSIAHEAAKPVALVQVPTTSRVRASSRTNVSLGSELDALGLASDLKAAVLNDVRQSDTDNKWDAAVCSLTTRIPVQGNSLLKNGGRVVIVGGTGVGKTTTIAKLAAHFARMHGPRSVALVNTDSFRVGASEQLRRYAKLMGIGICNVRGPSDLGRAFEHLSGRKLVLVDTAGTNYQDTRLMEHLEELRNAGENVTCYLAASFNTQTSVLDKTVRAFGRLPLDGCILTKADEAVSLGPAVSVAARHELPVGFVTTGPGVPADIRIARGDWLVERAMELAEQARREMDVQHGAQEVG